MKRQSDKEIPGNATNGRKRKKFDIDKIEGDLGIIESVSVQNFMCHDNLTLQFGSRLNFIIGNNGSGKSAILTAIILALGGKSRTTDRCSSIKGFVKNGKNKGKVEVVLRNKGDFAYKPEIYGEKITVIREFTKDGSSSYKIKSESGTICSNQKSELMNILESMDIVVESPVCVLTQANSKKFLISKDAKEDKLFDFYYKGTGLETIEKKYKVMSDTKLEAEEELNRKKASLPEMKKELDKWKRYLDSSKKISDYRNELQWATVIEMEQILQQKEEEYQELQKEIDIHKQDLETCKTKLTEKTAELADYINQQDQHNKSMTEFRERLEILKVEKDNCAAELRKYESLSERHDRDKKKLISDLSGLEKCIREQQLKDQDSINEDRRRCEEALQNLERKNAMILAAIENLDSRRSSKMKEQSNINDNIQSIRADIESDEHRKGTLEDHLRCAKNALLNRANAFGEKTVQVLMEIDKRLQQFKKRPVGPIGNFLEVKDEKWTNAVEFAIGINMLRSFCVDNHEDSLLLREILRKYYNRPPSIIVSPFESSVFDVSQHRAQSHHPTVMDMLKITNHLVANCLIDQSCIEKKLLVESADAASNELLRSPPRNCISAYLLNCDQISFNPYRYYSFNNIDRMRCQLRAIRKDDVEKIEKDLRDKIFEIQNRKKHLHKLQDVLDALPSELNDLYNQIVQKRTALRNNKAEITDLQCREEPKDINCLQEELQKLQNDLKRKEAEIEKCKAQVSEMKKKHYSISKEMEDQKNLLRSAQEDYHELHAKVNAISKQKETFASGKRKYEAELKACENKSVTCLRNLENIRTKTANARSTAEGFCERINTDRSREEINRLLKETEKVVESQSNCNREELSKKYLEKLENINRAEKELKKIEAYLRKIGEMLQLRQKKLTKISSNTQLSIDMAFTAILDGNGYKGHLEFDLVNSRLSLNVAPRRGDVVRKKHGSLSGGERSYVTIAFLLALWERTKMPFRILDEYDVFMDSNNRQLCFDLLKSKSEGMPQTQFIFLSPLDLPRIQTSPNTKVLRMPSPKRKHEDDD